MEQRVNGAPAPRLPKPTRRATPTQFYTEYLPCLWRAYTHGAPMPWPAWVFEIGVELHPGLSTPEAASATVARGDAAAAEPNANANANAFTLHFNSGQLTGRAGPPSNRPLFCVRTDEPSWTLSVQSVLRDVIRHGNQHLDASRRQLARWLATGGARLCVADVEDHPGRLTLTYTDDAGDEGRFEVCIGSGNGPSAHIHASDSDLWALLASGGNVLKLLRGWRIEGDVSYVLRLAALASAS